MSKTAHWASSLTLSGQESFNPVLQRIGILQLTFPNYHCLPAVFPKCAQMLLVALFCSFELWLPKIEIRFWHSGNLAETAVMLVPKATVYENHLFPDSKYEIRLSRHSFTM